MDRTTDYLPECLKWKRGVAAKFGWNAYLANQILQMISRDTKPKSVMDWRRSRPHESLAELAIELG